MKSSLNATSVHTDAKTMTARLTELGVQVSKSQMLEALASAYDCKSWHVMSAKLKEMKASGTESTKIKKTPEGWITEVPEVKHPFSIFMETYHTDEFASEPLSWVSLEISQQFVAHLIHQHNIAVENSAAIKIGEFPTGMGPASAESRMRYSSLAVTDQGYFWYEISSKYDRGHNEFLQLPVGFILSLLEKVNTEFDRLSEIALEISPHYSVKTAYFNKEKPYLLVYTQDSSNLEDVLLEDGILDDNTAANEG